MREGGEPVPFLPRKRSVVGRRQERSLGTLIIPTSGDGVAARPGYRLDRNNVF